MAIDRGRDDEWPELHLSAWQPTCKTLHMWSQVVGKTRLELTPPQNHTWHVPLYVSARGLTTSTIPFRDRTFEVTFDFIDHALEIETSRGERETVIQYLESCVPLWPRGESILQIWIGDIKNGRTPDFGSLAL